MSHQRLTDEELAREAQRWDNREVSPAEWIDAPDAVPRAKESVAISLRLPVKMVAILKEFARRERIGYQVLMKRWLDERIREERDRLFGDRRTIRLAGPEVVYRPVVFHLYSASRLSEGAVRDETGQLAEKVATKE
jgi:hypothetical protein